MNAVSSERLTQRVAAAGSDLRREALKILSEHRMAKVTEEWRNYMRRSFYTLYCSPNTKLRTRLA
jgi:hypothetical protein